MTTNTFDVTIRSFQKRAPFVPFFVELVSGDRVRVDHPEALVIRGGVAVYLSSAGAVSIFDPENVSQILTAPNPSAVA